MYQDIETALRKNCPNCSRRAEEGCDPKCVNCNAILKLFKIQGNELLKIKEELSKPDHIKRYEMDKCKLEKKFNKPLFYENQVKTSDEIIDKIQNNNNRMIHLLLAPTQSGKTGCILSIIDKFILCLNFNHENVHLITGLSSVDWVEQTKDRMPDCLHNQILHRPDIKKIKNNINKNNILIVIDEAHLGAQEKMTIDKIFKDIGIKDIDQLLSRNIHIVLVSATPNQVIKDIQKWKDNTSIDCMEPGKGYTGVRELSKQGQIFQAMDLFIDKDPDEESGDARVRLQKKIQPVYDELKKIRKLMLEMPILNHIFRVPCGYKGDVVINRIRSIYEHDHFDIIVCTGEDCNKLVRLLKGPIDKRRILIAKETVRCAVTVEKSRLGIIYDRISKKTDDSVIIQGIRITGYDVQPYNKIYTDIDSIQHYIESWKNKFDKNTVWNYNGKGRNSYVNPKSYNAEDYSEEMKEEPLIHKFVSFNEVKEFISKIGHKNPTCKKMNSDGFYKNYIRGKTSVMSCDEVYNNRRWGIKDSHRIHYCYEDVNDTSTLQYWIIHYPSE